MSKTPAINSSKGNTSGSPALYMENTLAALLAERQKFLDYLHVANADYVFGCDCQNNNINTDATELLLDLHKILRYYRKVQDRDEIFLLETLCHDVWSLLCPLMPIWNSHYFVCETSCTPLVGNPVQLFAGVFKLLSDLRQSIGLGGEMALSLRPSSNGTLLEITAISPEFTGRKQLQKLCNLLNCADFPHMDDILLQFMTVRNIRCCAEFATCDSKNSSIEENVADEKISLVFWCES